MVRACVSIVGDFVFFMYCLDLPAQISSVPFTIFWNQEMLPAEFCYCSCVYSVFSQRMHLVKPQKLLKCIVVPVEQPNTDLPSMAIGQKKHIPKTTQVSSDCRH